MPYKHYYFLTYLITRSNTTADCVLLMSVINDLYVQSPLFRRWRMVLYKL